MSSSWQDRQAGYRDDRSCFPSLIYKRNWVFSIQSTWQVSHKPYSCLAKGNPPYRLHSMPSTLCHLSSEDRGEKTEEGNLPSSSLELCHKVQLLHPRGRNISLWRLAKKRPHFYTWEQTVSQVNCTYATEQPSHSNLQHILVHWICKCYWFIYMALYKQSAYYTHRNSNSQWILRG